MLHFLSSPLSSSPLHLSPSCSSNLPHSPATNNSFTLLMSGDNAGKRGSEASLVAALESPQTAQLIDSNQRVNLAEGNATPLTNQGGAQKLGDSNSLLHSMGLNLVNHLCDSHEPSKPVLVYGRRGIKGVRELKSLVSSVNYGGGKGRSSGGCHPPS